MTSDKYGNRTHLERLDARRVNGKSNLLGQVSRL